MYFGSSKNLEECQCKNQPSMKISLLTDRLSSWTDGVFRTRRATKTAVLITIEQQMCSCISDIQNRGKTGV